MNLNASVYPPAPVAPGSLPVLGLPVHGGGAAAIKAFMHDVVTSGRQAVILYLNVHAVNLAHRLPWLKTYFERSQFVICDGDGIRWGLELLGQTAPPKVTYNVWLWDLAQWCSDEGRTLYLLGGRPGVAERAADRMMKRVPGLKLAGLHHGFFEWSGSQLDALLNDVRQCRPDLLLICLGMPRQEEWLARFASDLPVHVFLTGGAAIDYAAGDVPVVPRWMARLHLEWLFRLGLEPRRMFGRYVLGNPVFLLRVLRERWCRDKA